MIGSILMICNLKNGSRLRVTIGELVKAEADMANIIPGMPCFSRNVYPENNVLK